MTQAVPCEASELPPNSVLCVSASITMNCPASHAFNIMIDISTWPSWNTFVPKVDVTAPSSSAPTAAHAAILVEGSKMSFHVRMKPSFPIILQKEVVSAISSETSGTTEEYRIGWTASAVPRFLLDAQRSNIFRTVPGAETPQCEYRTWETMNGPMAYAVRASFGTTLQDRFEDWANDLKAYAEKTWAEGRTRAE